VGVFKASSSPPKERYAVTNDSVIKLVQPGSFDDPLTEVLRNGARALLAQAVEAEVAAFLNRHSDLRIEMAVLAWCVTASARARDHDRKKSTH
jgi:putative transposase